MVEKNERNSGEFENEEDKEFPRQAPLIHWRELNQTIRGKPFDYRTVTKICEEYKNENLDLRPYMIERPFQVNLNDKIDKVHLIFREMHLRQLIVCNRDNGKLEGIITRQDIF